MVLADEFEQALLSMDRLRARRVLLGPDGAGLTAQLRETIVVGALCNIGSAWERGQVALSQVYMSGRLCQEIIEAGTPVARDADEASRIAIGVLEDAHTLGKTMVLQMLRASGHPVRDLGVRLTVSDLVRQVEEHEIDILMISVLMLRSALRVTELRLALERRRPGTKVVVGGAPFRLDPQLWTEVGADGVGFNASDAIIAVERIGTGR
jgi:methanogenic corrinoid protein MtbC1